MSKKLDEALKREIGRFNQIMSYQDNLIKEGHYYFHQQLPEAEETEDPNTPPPVQATGDNAEAPEQGNPPAPAAEPSTIDPNDPNALPDPNAPAPGAEPTTGDEPAEPGAEPEMGAEPGMGTEPEMGAEPGMGGDDTTEVDVTDLVNNSNEVKMKVQDMLSKVDQTSQQFSSLMNRVGAIEANVNKMDVLVNKMQDLAQQVELMRPPTEAERRKAVAKESYPFSVTMDDYAKGQGEKNQTEMEKNPKMSMMKTLMQNYNDGEVRDSFYVPQENPFKNI